MRSPLHQCAFIASLKRGILNPTGAFRVSVDGLAQL